MTTAPEKRTPAGGPADAWCQSEQVGSGEPNPSGAANASAITYSRGVGQFDNTPEQPTVPTFRDFCTAVIADRAMSKGQQWFASAFAIAPDDAAHRGSDTKSRAIGKHHRCGSCAQPRRYVGLDVDSSLTPESYAALVMHLHRYSGLVYTTASHTPDAPRCRVLLELDVAAARVELITATQAIRARIDVAMTSSGFPAIAWDASCDKPEQPLYAVLTDSAVYKLEGQSLRLDDLLKDKPSVATSPHHTIGAPLAASASPSNAIGFAFSPNVDPSTIVVATERHADMTNLTGRLARQIHFDGLDRNSALAMVYAERARGRWTRDMPDVEIESALDGALNHLRSGTWSRPDEPHTAQVKPAEPTKEQAQAPHLFEVDLSDLGSAALSPTHFVFDPIIPRGVVTMLDGHGGSGKSSLALILAAHAACDTSWAGFKCGDTA